jgi:Putative glycosyl/glycerophosphate transferases involved in teichoic acid biosynthesis TagF/TagB/EpsJ/RodC
MVNKENFKHFKITVLHYLYRIYPIKNNKIVFCNYVGKGYGCNSKYIAEELIRRNLGLDIVWITKDTTLKFPKQIRVVEWESPKAVWELSTARVWVDNQRKLPYHKKRKGQYFIETWHGGTPLKKIGADNPLNKNDLPYKKTSLHMDKIVNLMIANSSWVSKVYRSAFLYTGKILECGYPRNDILVNNTDKYNKQIRKYYHLEDDIKLALYAPTYRKGRKTDMYKLDYNVLCTSLEKRFGGRWKVLVRLHPTMAEKSNELNYTEDVINVSAYDDMQELMAGTDVLISDYSTIIGEFPLSGKPVFLFATDKESYAKERDFYYDYDKLPFPQSGTNKGLAKVIEEFDDKKYADDLKEYYKIIGRKDYGNASVKVADIIIDVMKLQNK